MNIKRQMLLSHLLVGSVPVLIALILFALIFQSQWESEVNQTMASTLNEIRNQIEAETDRYRFFAFTLARIAPDERTLLGTMTRRNEQLQRFLQVFHMNSIALSKLAEIFVENERVLIESPDIYVYQNYVTSQEEAGDIWEELSSPKYHALYVETKPTVLTDGLVIRTCAILTEPNEGRKIGLSICSFPINSEFLRFTVENRPSVVAFIETTNSITFSQSDFNDLGIQKTVLQTPQNDKPFVKIKIKNLGEYYMSRQDLFYETSSEYGKLNINVIARLGVLYPADIVEQKLSLYRYIGVGMLALITLIVNIIALILARDISNPILQLKDLILKFKNQPSIIPAPSSISTELDLLQQGFHEMSEALVSDFERSSLVQRSILTDKEIYEEIHWLEIDVCYLPMNGKVSGDYYHISLEPDDRVSIMIADASGHGTQAALSTMQMDVLNRETFNVKEPAERLAYIDYKLTNILKTKNYFTCFYIRLSHRGIVFSSAGHPGQLLLRKGETAPIELRTEGHPIGVVKPMGSVFTQEDFPIRQGDVILLFTDGLYEQFNSEGKEYGEKKLIRHIESEMKRKLFEQPVKTINARILKAIENFREGSPPTDDIILVAIRIK